MKSKRLEIFESNYGRNAGWYVEYHDKIIAELQDCKYEEMFWDSYRIIAKTDNYELKERIISSKDLWHDENLVFRSIKFNKIVTDVIVAGKVFVDEKRVMIRGLYLNIGSPTLLEKIKLFIRSHIPSK